ncbi:MAG TPA: endo-1,4-beta-xylanase [Candidatus Saccharimonadales bacterium]|nr:endo-1,4-beta-xylanase [Candidatus Saccharimonadales bacterium]
MGKHKKNKNNVKKPAAITLASIFAVGIISFTYWYLSLTAPKLPEPPLKELASAHKISLGVHVQARRLDDRIYPGIVSSQFDFVTVDGGIHFQEVQPSLTRFDFSKADPIVEFAEKHNMSVQMHHLVWGDDFVLPAWLTEGKFNKQQILDILHKHITTIVKHYKGRIKEYTVVNEAFTENQHVYGLRNWWAEHIGNDMKYIDDYFIWAHRADPKAKLLLNDFNDQTKNSVSDAIYKYVKAAKARGVPIDGVGMQMHIDASQPSKKQDVIDNMKRFGKIGVPVYVTEFDVNTNSVKGSDAYKNRLESKITYDMVRACIESKACISFDAFGVTSRNDLIKKITRANSRAYMFDSRFRPRSAFYSFRQAWLEP